MGLSSLQGESCYGEPSICRSQWKVSLARGLVSSGNLVVWSILFGIGANIYFCLGLYTEFIVIALGFPLSARKIRYFLFSLELLISLGSIVLLWGFVEFSV